MNITKQWPASCKDQQEFPSCNVYFVKFWAFLFVSHTQKSLSLAGQVSSTAALQAWSIQSIHDNNKVDRFENSDKITQHLWKVTISTSFDKHGKSLPDDHVHDCRAPLVPHACAETTVGNKEHNLVKGFRSQKPVDSTLCVFTWSVLTSKCFEEIFKQKLD